ncbi:MAG: phage tail tape measure protein, partial [Gammaproteobacteria bacterium]|nr:phage tail tape measure protein [Gammaproteobacteria bacterium]
MAAAALDLNIVLKMDVRRFLADIRNVIQFLNRLNGSLDLDDSSLEDIIRDLGRLDGELDDLDRDDLDDVSDGADDLNDNTNTLAGSIKGLVAAWLSFETMDMALDFLKESVLSFAEFDDSVRRAAAVTGEFDVAYKAFTAKAGELGERTRYTATQAAEGLQFLAMAGLDVKQSIGAIPHVLRLATVGNMELGEASDILTNIMSQTRQEVEDLVHVNDVLAKTATSSNTSISELGFAFGQIGSVGTAV